MRRLSQVVLLSLLFTLAGCASLTASRSELLSVQSQPPGAQIALDGAPAGSVTPGLLADVPSGSHLLELTLAGYRPWSGQVAVDEGKTRDLLVTATSNTSQRVDAVKVAANVAEVVLPDLLVRFSTGQYVGDNVRNLDAMPTNVSVRLWCQRAPDPISCKFRTTAMSRIRDRWPDRRHGLLRTGA